MRKAKLISVNIARVLLGCTFVVSGFVKAIDPLGSQYKLHDYAEAIGLSAYIPDLILLVVAVLLSALEFVMGAMVLLASWRRLVSKVALAFMTVMTLITVWIYFADPVQDCGCFGDALVLSNSETLLKNIVLLACAALVAYKPMMMSKFLSKNVQGLLEHIVVITPLVLSMWCLYDLPLLDFRPYHVGADIKAGMEVPEGAEQPEFETTFIMEKDGVRKEFTLDDYPDSTWTFIDSKTVTLKKGYVPPIHDFTIVTADGNDITDDVLGYKGYTFLLVSPHLDSADDTNFGNIDEIYEFAQDNGHRFYCLTASGEEAIVRWKGITGAEYEFCQTDGTTLKTVVRSNPGMLLLKGGVVMGKWSHNWLPTIDQLDSLTQ